ncbi:hypothetical protein A1O1_08385 [Capronia coronata CBS 617.96]|uniref:C2H2-type domain-containing protein n=1 Tax=Capronia coronata CBS 617.96 TaxID=1182541 RepID=W9XJ49_9EURO|nr:uncharacterized protein A1O1_08385 [Capronia coronata CBS 617.96]EXJ80243.1 hypothetical protein A1O1_08385 [Capronia coronata CBS 617.96]
MGTSLDALNAPASLTQRRQAASNLPAFELPPPSNIQFTPISTHKIPPLSGLGASHAGPGLVSLGQLLTPPSNSASEGSATSSGISTTPNSAAVPVLPYTPSFFNTGTTPTGYNTGFTPQPWHNGNALLPPRSMFSPMGGPQMRHHTNSPTAGEASALPPPPYDLNSVQPYGASLPMSSPMSATNSAHQHHVLSSLQNGLRPPSQQSPISPHDGVSKPSPNPALFTTVTSTGPHPSSYAYATSTPVSQSPHLHGLHGPRMSPTLHQGPLPPQPQAPFMRPPPPSYSLPAMPGPIMTNVHSPGAQMAMVGNMQANMLPVGFNSGYAANPQAMYGQQRTNAPQQPPIHDRPFKCDQCPQSFNRNHDLKRHKRIHLAVKPFPCTHCDKSFSRKDALKRHILVKGCGSGSTADGMSRDEHGKSDSGSDVNSGSPAAATAA